jgi:uncharacterized membrane protein
MDRFVGFLQQYYDKVMIWYNGHTFVEQMGILLVVIVLCAAVPYFMMKK